MKLIVNGTKYNIPSTLLTGDYFKALTTFSNQKEPYTITLPDNIKDFFDDWVHFIQSGSFETGKHLPLIEISDFFGDYKTIDKLFEVVIENNLDDTLYNRLSQNVLKRRFFKTLIKFETELTIPTDLKQFALDPKQIPQPQLIQYSDEKLGHDFVLMSQLSDLIEQGDIYDAVEDYAAVSQDYKNYMDSVASVYIKLPKLEEYYFTDTYGKVYPLIHVNIPVDPTQSILYLIALFSTMKDDPDLKREIFKQTSSELDYLYHQYGLILLNGLDVTTVHKTDVIAGVKLITTPIEGLKQIYVPIGYHRTFIFGKLFYFNGVKTVWNVLTINGETVMA